MNSKPMKTGAAVCVVAVVGIVLMTKRRSDAPETFGSSTDGIPNILKVGDIKGAMKQSEELVAALKERNWERRTVPFTLMHFPDQKYAESSADRDPQVACAAVPDADSKIYKEIAFFTDIYVRRNVLRLKDEQTITNPEGFYIVGYRNGEVKQVPLDEVRLIPQSMKPQYLECFPGQAIYDPSWPKLDYVANAHKKR